MPVDKFGLMGDDPSVTQIQPINKQAYNLDDLENVEGFYKKGSKDKLYCLQLKDDGIYHRADIPVGAGGLTTNERHKAMIIVSKNASTWIPLPLYYQWDIDLQLNFKSIITTVTKGENHVLQKIFNSGLMNAALILNHSHKNSTVLVRDGRRQDDRVSKSEYYIAASTVDTKKMALLHFETEFEEDKTVLEGFPPGSAVKIDGRIDAENSENESVYIIRGVNINFLSNKPSPPFDFRIVIRKEQNNEVFTITPEGLDVYREKNEIISFGEVMLHDFYFIKRIRFTTSPVSDDEIKYL